MEAEYLRLQWLNNFYEGWGDGTEAASILEGEIEQSPVREIYSTSARRHLPLITGLIDGSLSTLKYEFVCVTYY